MKSDCVLNDDELEEKRQVIIKNRIKRMKRNRFYCCSCEQSTENYNSSPTLLIRAQTLQYSLYCIFYGV